MSCLILLFLLSAKAGADAHQDISDDLVRLADTVDEIFGEPRATDQVNRTSLRLTNFYTFTGRGDDLKGTEVRLNLKLPILERRSRELTEPLRYDNQEQGKTSILNPKGPFLFQPKSLIDRVHEKTKWSLRAEPGVKISSRSSFFEKARATKSFFTGRFVHNFSQEVSWDSRVAWQETTLLENDFALNDRLLLRFTNQGDWQISQTHFHGYHGPSLIQKLNDISALSYGAQLMTQVENARWYADTYTLSVNYRRSVYSNWAFLDLTPALVFEKVQGFKGMTNFTARLEFLFGAI